jgi:hypothetical protein
LREGQAILPQAGRHIVQGVYTYGGQKAKTVKVKMAKRTD